METIEIGELSVLLTGVHLSLRKRSMAEKQRVANEIGRIITRRLAARFDGEFSFKVIAIEDGCIKVRLKLFWKTICDNAERAVYITAALVTIAGGAKDLMGGPGDTTRLQCGGITVQARYDGSDFTPGCHYTTEAGDSLSHILTRYPRTPYTHNQLLVATFRKNPQAFADNNMNRLRVDRTLVFPTLKEVGRVSPAQADQLVAEHERRLAG